MATDSFKFWDSYYHAMQRLSTDEQRGKFVMAVCQYVFDGVDPTFDDPVVEFGFGIASEQARESKELSARKRQGGIKSGEARRSKSQTNTVPKSLPKSVRKSVPNEKKREEGNGSDPSSLREEGGAGDGGFAPPPPQRQSPGRDAT